VDAVVVDHAPTALRQAGPVVAAVAAGVLEPGTLVELGDVVAHGRNPRADPRGIVYYNSVGLGVQDAAAACALLGIEM
jgi:ornithine cyclodeaminase/alanine dehydrogenase-like protein (mu-crystallin family)